MDMRTTIGGRFGHWVVIALAPNQRNGRHVIAQCDCGSERNVVARDIESGKSKACTNCGNKTHGHTRKGWQSPTYLTWHGMIQRCTNIGHCSYGKYGGRGITVCDRWLKFDAFLVDVGERPSGKTLDRIDVNGNYELTNVRWATRSEQARNRRDTRLTPQLVDDIKNRVKSGEGVRAVSRDTGISSGQVSRISRGFDWGLGPRTNSH